MWYQVLKNKMQINSKHQDPSNLKFNYGLSTPPVLHGLHLKILHTIFGSALSTPYLCKAPFAYSLQVGWKRQQP